MDQLWAPWRDKYISAVMKPMRGCVFCRIGKERADKKNLIFVRAKYCFAVLNLFPYNNGHILLMPYRHVNDLQKLHKAESDELFELLIHTKKLLTKVLRPQGFNVGINLGRIAGAGFPGHLHVHVVPRWKGDMNFMPVVGSTKVISQSLHNLHQSLVTTQKRTPFKS